MEDDTRFSHLLQLKSDSMRKEHLRLRKERIHRALAAGIEYSEDEDSSEDDMLYNYSDDDDEDDDDEDERFPGSRSALARRLAGYLEERDDWDSDSDDEGHLEFGFSRD